MAYEPGSEPGGAPGAEPGSDGPGAAGPGAAAPGAASNDNNNDPNDIRCICGEKFKVNKAKDCYGGGGVLCDGCGKSIANDKLVYHCPNEKTKKHENGYDLCRLCALKIINNVPQSDGLTEGGTADGPGGLNDESDDDEPKIFIPSGYDKDNPPCICGKELEKLKAS